MKYLRCSAICQRSPARAGEFTSQTNLSDPCTFALIIALHYLPIVILLFLPSTGTVISISHIDLYALHKHSMRVHVCHTGGKRWDPESWNNSLNSHGLSHLKLTVLKVSKWIPLSGTTALRGWQVWAAHDVAANDVQHDPLRLGSLPRMKETDVDFHPQPHHVQQGVGDVLYRGARKYKTANTALV